MAVENSNSGGWFGAGFGLGLLVGGFFIYILVKSKATQPVLQTANPQPIPALPPINLYPTFSFKEPPPVPQIALPPVPAPVPQPQVAEPVTTFKNNEKWLIDRNEKGIIRSLQIIRDAKVNGTA